MFEKSKDRLREAKAKMALAKLAMRYGADPTSENEATLRQATESYVGRPYDQWSPDEQAWYKDMLGQVPGA